MFVSGVYSNQFDDLMGIAELVTTYTGDLSEIIQRDLDIKNEMWKLYIAQWFYLSAMKHLIKSSKNIGKPLHEESIKKYNKLLKNMAKKTGMTKEDIEKQMPSTNTMLDIISSFRHLENFADTHNATEMKGYPIYKEMPTWTIQELHKIEDKILKETKDKIPFKSLSQYNVIKKYSDNFVWLNLETNRCSLEAQATGHCGTTTYDNSTLLSLRKIETVGSKKYFIPKVTIELTSGNYIAQCKGTKREGKSNVPIAPEFKQYVWDLIISQKNILGIMTGTNYEGVPIDDFLAIVDSPEDLKYLLEKRDNFDFMTMYAVLDFNYKGSNEYEEIEAELKPLRPLVIKKYPRNRFDDQSDIDNVVAFIAEEFTEEEDNREDLLNSLIDIEGIEPIEVGQRYNRQIIYGTAFEVPYISEDDFMEELSKKGYNFDKDELEDIMGIGDLQHYIYEWVNGEIQLQYGEDEFTQNHEITSPIHISYSSSGDTIFIGVDEQEIHIFPEDKKLRNDISRETRTRNWQLMELFLTRLCVTPFSGEDEVFGKAFITYLEEVGDLKSYFKLDPDVVKDLETIARYADIDLNKDYLEFFVENTIDFHLSDYVKENV